MKILFHIFYILLTISSLLIADPIIQLPNGKIRGREGVTSQGNTYYGFEKVPYAAPPIGKLRFKAPQPPESWDGIRDTTSRDVSCYQQSANGDYESEDCLFANVYTTVLPTETDNSTKLPVMFFIHGGGYVGGSNMWQEPENLLDHGVLVVIINYRLGPFGFLSTQDEVIPGNNGLKDQQQAIRWTYENIHLFGGDRNMITIFGQSAGGSSITYQLLNNGVEGMIRGAICESGTYLSPWSYQRRAREIAFATATILNETFATNDNSQDLLEFLQSVPAKDLDDASDKYHDRETPEDLELSQGFYWAPIVEVMNEDAFMTEKMYVALKAGNLIKVPILIGINSEEMLFNNRNATKLKETMSTYDEHSDWLVPNDMLISDQDKLTEMGLLIRELYTKGEPLADHLGDGIRFFSDNSFTRSVIKYAEIASQFSPVYFYEFSYDGQLGGYDINYEGAEHVAHNEELNYIFGNSDYHEYPESDQLTQRRIIKIWTDFAKYQNPTPQPSDLLQNITWPLVSIETGDFLYVDINENLEIRNHPKEETYTGWTKLYNSLGYDDFDTY